MTTLSTNTSEKFSSPYFELEAQEILESLPDSDGTLICDAKVSSWTAILAHEKKYASFDLLRQQIFKDAQQAREYFKDVGCHPAT